MKLKEYQKRVLDRLEAYCKELHEAISKLQKVRTIDPSLASSIDPPELAWDKLTGGKLYHKRRNGLKESLPDLYLKVPTGGGKSLLGTAVSVDWDVYSHSLTHGIILLSCSLFSGKTRHATHGRSAVSNAL